MPHFAQPWLKLGAERNLSGNRGTSVQSERQGWHMSGLENMVVEDEVILLSQWNLGFFGSRMLCRRGERIPLHMHLLRPLLILFKSLPHLLHHKPPFLIELFCHFLAQAQHLSASGRPVVGIHPFIVTDILEPYMARW